MHKYTAQITVNGRQVVIPSFILTVEDVDYSAPALDVLLPAGAYLFIGRGQDGLEWILDTTTGNQGWPTPADSIGNEVGWVLVAWDAGSEIVMYPEFLSFRPKERPA